jgi:hypothetical protein
MFLQAPVLDVKLKLRDIRNQNVQVTAPSRDVWDNIASVELYYETANWTRSGTRIVLKLEKNTSPNYSAVRCFKIPPEQKLHGLDFELVFKLADGREWFRKSELKPLSIEENLLGIINVLKFFNVMKDSDLLWIRQFFILIYRWRFTLIVILAVIAVQVVMNLPLIGPLLSSIIIRICNICISFFAYWISLISRYLGIDI